MTIFIAALLLAPLAWADVTFVTPQADAQVIGTQIVEIATDAQNIDRVEFHVDGVLIGVARQAPYRVAFDFGTTLEGRRITANVLSDRYRRKQTAEIMTAALSAGESMNIDLVEVPMRVRSSRPIEPADLRLRENSVEQTIREIQPSRSPAHFAFVVDRSLSMKGGKLAAAVAAVRDAAELLRAGDTSSLLMFNHRVARPQALDSALVPIPSGGTSLRDAVASTMATGTKRTYIIVVTDGGDRNSILSEEAALRRISGTKSIVSAVVLGSASRFLRTATTKTGGALLTASKDTVRKQVRRIIEDINSRYTIVYQSRGTRAGWRSISIEPRRGRIEIVAARKGYFAE